MKSGDVIHHPDEVLSWTDADLDLARFERAPWMTIIFPKAELKLRSSWIARSEGRSASIVMAACLKMRTLDFIYASEREAVFLLGKEATAFIADNPSHYFDITAHIGGFAVKGSTAIH